MTAAGVFHFGPFVLEPAERRLTRDGRPIALTPKAFDLLVFLVCLSGHAVGKDEILQVLWPGRYVVEANLTKHVWLVRRALGDADGRYIQTVSKMGYRFVGEMAKALGPGAGEAAAPAL